MTAEQMKEVFEKLNNNTQVPTHNDVFDPNLLIATGLVNSRQDHVAMVNYSHARINGMCHEEAVMEVERHRNLNAKYAR